MTKALFRKQMMEVFSWLYKDKKSGKNRTKGGIIGFAVLYLLLFGFLGGIFYVTANMLCAPLYEIGFGWLYFALMGLIAVALGVFGSVFNTYSTLYQAKDNDLLLSMPVPTMYILTARLSGVYIMGFMYEIIVMIPTLIAWFMYADCNVAGIVFSILIPFIMYSTMCLSFTGHNSMLSSPACLYVCVLSDNFSAVLFNQCAEGLS